MNLLDIGVMRMVQGRRLDATGLYYCGARYYDTNAIRFISSDSVVLNPANPQRLNRYVCTNELKLGQPGVRILNADLFNYLAGELR
jgi:RHS repeat-associated protein